MSFADIKSDNAVSAESSDLGDELHENTQQINERRLPSRTNSTQSVPDDDNDEVRALAAKLAPDLERADALFHVPAEFMAPDKDERDSDYDDDLSEEEHALLVSERLLREEMELASDFSKLFASPRYSFDKEDQDQDTSPIASQNSGSPHEGTHLFSWKDPVPSMLSNASSTMEADVDANEQQHVPEQDLHLKGVSKLDTTDEVLAPIPMVRKRSPAGMASPAVSGVLLVTPNNKQASVYTNSDHLNTLDMQVEEKGWYTLDLTSLVAESSGDETTLPQSGVLKEFCLALPESRLKHVFIGLPDRGNSSSSAAVPAAVAQQQQQPVPILPVRTVTVRIRPDVLCGAVMDSVYNALETQSAMILKRQGGHIKASLPPAVYRAPDDDNGDDNTESDSPKVVHYPALYVDVQLCTYKSDNCARLLLIRVYHETTSGDLLTPSRLDQETDLDVLLASTPTDSIALDTPVDETASYRLREACALIQRIETPKKKSKRIDASPAASPQDMRQLVSAHLSTNYQACPSVKEGTVTMPSLNSDDWPVVLSSWRIVSSIYEQVSERDLVYTSLHNNWFGAFPALPTLDVHYCSQIRRLSREGMIVELLKSASDLEDFAREAEYACANMISLLTPTFETYNVIAPSLPKPTPLTAYPLEFTAPQQACPPWGQKVMSALNEIQSWTDQHNGNETINGMDQESSKKSVEMAEKAVSSVLRAFQQQDDEEKNARLGRKNVQVMDRLAKMEEHQLACMSTLDLAHHHSEKAKIAAEEFETKSGYKEVPLIKWSIVVGSSTGTCLVTARRIMFVTQLIPVIGGSKIASWDLQDVDFSVQEGAASLLNPLPTVISVKKQGREVYSFRPSMEGARLKSFLDIVTATSSKLPANDGEV